MAFDRAAGGRDAHPVFYQLKILGVDKAGQAMFLDGIEQRLDRFLLAILKSGSEYDDLHILVQDAEFRKQNAGEQANPAF